MIDQLDAEGAKDNLDVLDEGIKEIPRPEIDFAEWHDDIDISTNWYPWSVNRKSVYCWGIQTWEMDDVMLQEDIIFVTETCKIMKA